MRSKNTTNDEIYTKLHNARRLEEKPPARLRVKLIGVLIRAAALKVKIALEAQEMRPVLSGES
jgi:hypothetical protein